MSPPGESGALAYSKISERLELGEIFLAGTWDRQSVRAAAYDLRIADDFLIISRGEGERAWVYDQGRRRREPITLQPGQMAYVSTAERLAMPWDLVGQIGIKSSWARRGLEIRGGAFVDPGFGQHTEGGERLHFLLMNTSARDVHLHPGVEKVASLQLFTLVGDVPAEIRERPVRGMEDAREVLFEESPEGPPGVDLALGYFRELSAVRGELHELTAAGAVLDKRLSDVQSGALPLITFGFAVLGVTFLGVIFSTLVSLGGDARLVDKLSSIRKAAGGGVGLLGLSIVLYSLGSFGGRLIGYLSAVALRARTGWLSRRRTGAKNTD